MLSTSTFNFLSLLEENNNREWFNANKKLYNEAKADFHLFVDELITGIDDFDHHLEGLSAQESVFRIYRDVRFSKNKEPYKSHFGAYIAFGGRKSSYAGYYIHVKPGHCFLGGGMYKPGSAVIKKIRQEIDYNPRVLQEILNEPAFKETFDEIKGEKLTSAPQGYPKDHENIELLKLKSFFVLNDFDDEKLQNESAVGFCLNNYKKLYPFNRFFNETFIN